CRIFGEILHIEQVGIKDGFFALGGDSIKAIRVVSKLREQHIHVSVKDVMTQKTAQAIAAIAVKETSSRYQQTPVTGTLELTPVMNWILSADMPNFAHFNQSVLLQADCFDRAALKTALDSIAIHHDMLRAVYDGTVLQIRGINSGILYTFQEVDVTGIVSVEEIAKMIYERGTAIQKSIDLAKGPLMKAAVFRTDTEEHLLIVIHHLCVDAVSLRILVDDFKIAYAQALRHETVVLPEKTASFQEWAQALKEYGMTRSVQEEKGYWKKVTQQFVQAKIPVSNTGITGWNNVYITLQKEVTNALIYHSNHAYGTEINDLLLTALGIAVHKTYGNTHIGIRMEGHGRESIHKAMEIDRTVGWFTCTYPVVLEIGEEIAGNIVSVKETLRKVPNNGIGYGVLWNEEAFDVREKEDLISFNYLGNFEEGVPEQQEFIQISQYSGGQESADGNYPHAFWNINGVLSDGVLRFTLEYDASKYKESMISNFVNNFKDALGMIAEHCKNQIETVQTPSDFGLQQLSMEHVQELLLQAEDLYPLTPLQEGMFYQGMAEEEKGAYVLQTVYRIRDTIEIATMETAFALTAEKYPVIKTRIIGQGLEQHVQLIAREMDYTIKQIDLTGKGNAVLAAIVEEDVRCGFDLESDNLFRIQVVKLNSKEFCMIISVHHIILDGWSMPIVIGQLFQYYARLIR
ncbi:MAG: condensation domain-containing protein, partial [Ruminococcus sp.]